MSDAWSADAERVAGEIIKAVDAGVFVRDGRTLDRAGLLKVARDSLIVPCGAQGWFDDLVADGLVAEGLTRDEAENEARRQRLVMREILKRLAHH